MVWVPVQVEGKDKGLLEGARGMENEEKPKFRRAVGFCVYKDCSDLWKDHFLLNHGPKFYCPRCRVVGLIVPEKSWVTGKGEKFHEARVEFTYDPQQLRYRDVAIVKDEGLKGKGRVYHLQSPLVRTDKRALKVAECILANLHRQPEIQDGTVVGSTEILMDICKSREEFKAGLDSFLSLINGDE